jgi:hypothetical protein
MYPYMNEDAAWQRLQDIQREMENRRLMAAGRPHATLGTLRQLAARAWLLAGLAAMRPPRRRPGRGQRDGERRSHIA